MTKRTRARKYRVTYAITRTEYYEIEAKTAKEAEDRAFSDGEFIDNGETTNVVAWGVEEVTP